MKMWLIQRGHRISNKPRPKGLLGDRGLIELDYMGSVEFENGAISDSYARILFNYTDYVFYKTKITPLDDKALWLFVHKNQIDEIESCIHDYLKQPYTLQEPCRMEEHFNKTTNALYTYFLDTNFWWDIKNDWIAFLGSNGIKSLYEKAIAYDYQKNIIALPTNLFI